MFKKNRELYAFTENKKYDKLFSQQRCKKSFDRVVIQMNEDDPRLRLFRADNSNKLMINIPLTDRNMENISLIGTYEEEARLDQAHEYVWTTNESIVDKLHELYEEGYITKKFFKNAISIFDYSWTESDIHSTSIDTFHLFWVIHYRTFVSPDKWDCINDALGESSVHWL